MSVDHTARAKKMTPAELAFELRELAQRFPSSEAYDYINEAARRLRPAPKTRTVKRTAKAKQDKTTPAKAEVIA